MNKVAEPNGLKAVTVKSRTGKGNQLGAMDYDLSGRRVVHRDLGKDIGGRKEARTFVDKAKGEFKEYQKLRHQNSVERRSESKGSSKNRVIGLDYGIFEKNQSYDFGNTRKEPGSEFTRGSTNVNPNSAKRLREKGYNENRIIHNAMHHPKGTARKHPAMKDTKYSTKYYVNTTLIY